MRLMRYELSPNAKAAIAELNEAQARLAEAERELEEAVAELKRQEVDSCC